MLCFGNGIGIVAGGFPQPVAQPARIRGSEAQSRGKHPSFVPSVFVPGVKAIIPELGDIDNRASRIRQLHALLFMNHFDRVQARGHPRGVQSGQYRDAPDQSQRAHKQLFRRVKLNGPAEALLIDYEY